MAAPDESIVSTLSGAMAAPDERVGDAAAIDESVEEAVFEGLKELLSDGASEGADESIGPRDEGLSEAEGDDCPDEPLERQP